MIKLLGIMIGREKEFFTEYVLKTDLEYLYKKVFDDALGDFSFRSGMIVAENKRSNKILSEIIDEFKITKNDLNDKLKKIEKQINKGKNFPKDNTEKACIWCGYVIKKDSSDYYCGNCGARW